MKKYRIVLTDAEYNLLQDLTRQTGTDCWFSLSTDADGFDCVYDLERKRKITLRYAITVLNDTITPELFNEVEIYIYNKLLEKLNIKH